MGVADQIDQHQNQLKRVSGRGETETGDSRTIRFLKLRFLEVAVLNA